MPSKVSARKDARSSPPGIVPSAHGALSVQGAWKRWAVRASGMHAGAVLVSLAVILLLLLADPQTNARHLVLTLITCFICGMFVSGVMMYGRVQDALKAKDDFRAEMNRIAERNRELERMILKNRLSSAVRADLAASVRAALAAEGATGDDGGNGKRQSAPRSKGAKA